MTYFKTAFYDKYNAIDVVMPVYLLFMSDDIAIGVQESIYDDYVFAFVDADWNMHSEALPNNDYYFMALECVMNHRTRKDIDSFKLSVTKFRFVKEDYQMYFVKELVFESRAQRYEELDKGVFGKVVDVLYERLMSNLNERHKR
ncbi:MAG: hypothetical protein WHS64_03055 [Fervidobacterium sp.]|uniref:hypothetical protein n=1 Tax=Fervidobacterium sp. TaxID=1871331 RepID=UPI0030AEDDD3